MAYMPYMHFYINQINSNNDLHLIYWQRDKKGDVKAPMGVVTHPFNQEMSDSLPLIKKLPLILQFGRFAKKTIKELEPDFLIVLHSTTAFTIRHLLFNKYYGRYIFDFRDVTYERKYSFYKECIAQIVKHSAITFTSSDAYRQFLPQCDKILTSHNFLIENLYKRKQYKACRNKLKIQPIKIAFWGLLRHYDLNKLIIERLANDSRFELHYYGRAQGVMLELMKECASLYNNFFFHGEYKPCDRDDLAMSMDLIHNLYSNEDTNMPFAMSNKYYDGLMYYIPQLCMRGSYMGEKCSLYGIGLECDPHDDNFGDYIWEYYQALDYDKFCECCDKVTDVVEFDYRNGCNKIRQLVDNANQ